LDYIGEETVIYGGGGGGAKKTFKKRCATPWDKRETVGASKKNVKTKREEPSHKGSY